MKKIFIPLLVYLCVFAAVFIAIESPPTAFMLVSSLLDLSHDDNSSLFAESVHTEYDKDIGWINKPGLFLKDLYGPGKYFKSNARSFRNNKDIADTVKTGTVRIICSGDSFTLGYGVDNDHTWPSSLAAFNKNIEAVNMGQGGYGIDQAYLWYMRDGRPLDHDIQILAFITSDFKRMLRKRSFGYNKPFLQIENEAIKVKNTPVPVSSPYAQWLTRNIKIIERLKTVSAFRRFYLKHVRKNEKETKTRRAVKNPVPYSALPEIVVKLFEDLDKINKEKNSTFVAVYLPTMGDSKPSPETDKWREFLSSRLREKGIVFFDLIPYWQRLPGRGDLVITGRDIPYAGAYGHYSEKGNKFIASLIYKKLLSDPRTLKRFVDKLSRGTG